MIRVVLADDQALVRGGFRMILESEPDIVVVGEADDGERACALAQEQNPDVVLLDVRMPVVDGIEAAARIATFADPPRVLMLTTFGLDEYVYEALRAGASGFLLKTVDPSGLVDAVRTVHAGHMLVSPEITRSLVEAFVGKPTTDGRAKLDALTPREVEVMRLVAKGLKNAEIARELYLGESTVKSHIVRILSKLHLRDRAQIVVAAYESGLVSAGAGG